LYLVHLASLSSRASFLVLFPRPQRLTLFPYTTLFRFWIGGKPVTGSSHRTGPVWNPATGEQQAEVLLADATDVDTAVRTAAAARSEEHTSELQSRENLVCRLLLEK